MAQSIPYEQACFAGGEFDPQVSARIDLAKYKTACKVLRNFWVSVNGIAHNRTGLQYVTPTYYSTTNQSSVQNVKLIPFQFSTTQSYVLEFGNYYMRVIKNGALVLSGGSPYVLPTPYAAIDVMGIYYTQSADTLFLSHPNYAPQQLQRINDTNWNIQNYAFLFGPFLLENTSPNYTLTPSSLNLPTTDNSFLGVGTNVSVTAMGQVSAVDAHTKLMLHLDNNVTDSETTPKTVTNNNVIFSNSVAKSGYSGYFNSGNDTAYTQLLLHLDNNVTDSSNNGITVTNNSVTFSNSIDKFGYSGVFGGAAYLSVPNSSAFNFGTGDFTIDFWVYIPANPAVLGPLFNNGYSSGAGNWIIYINDSGYWIFDFNNGYGEQTVSPPVAPLALNQWNHLAVVRVGGVTTAYTNGIGGTPVTISASVGLSPYGFTIGNYSSYYLNGYMDEIRISKGIGRWTGNFTPPAGPYTAGASLTVPDSTDWNMGTNDFTIEGWFNFDGVGIAQWLFSQYTDANNDMDCSLTASGNISFVVKSGASNLISFSTTGFTPSVGIWNHVAVVRHGTLWTIYINGVSYGSQTASVTYPDYTGTFQIGSFNATASLAGYVDEFRVSNTARYTANFTPPSYSTFQSGHVGSLWGINQYVPNQSLASASMTSSAPTSSIVCGSGTWRLITNGTWTGNIWVEKSLDAGLTWLMLAEYTGANNFNINTYGTEDMSNNAPPFLVRCNSSGFSGTATITLTSDPYINFGIVSITTVQSGSLAYGQVVQPIGINNSPSSDWAEGAWSIYRGWPSVVEFTPDDRLMWSNSPYRPQTSWFTQTSNYYNFNVNNPLVDSDSIDVNLPSRQINGINGIIPLRAILALTTSGEWSLESTSGVSAPITPSTIYQRVHGYEGSQGVKPLIIGIRGIFVQSLGKVLRDVGYELIYDSFVGANISVFSNHLFYFDKIIDMCYSQNPDSLVWIVMQSGALRSLTYLREQQVVTFARHDTEGYFMSTCSISDSVNNYNVPYFVVNRANGQFIEYMPKRMNSQLIQDQFFVDCGGIYDAIGQTFQNPDFESWTLGPNAQPDGWTLLAGTISQSSYVEDGTYSAGLLNGTLHQSMYQAYGMAYWQNRSVTFKAWVNCAVANCASVSLYDGITTAQSAYHTGDGTWQQLSVTTTISSTATLVRAQCVTSGGIAYFDNSNFNSGVSTITGATWLNGQTISILADGNVLPQQLVSGGTINLGAHYNKIAYGLPFYADLQPVNPDINVPGGTIQGRVIKTGRTVLKVWNSAGGYIGSSFSSLKQIAELKNPSALITGDAKCVVDGGYLDDNSVCIRQSDPLPLSVTAIISELQIGGIKTT